MQIARPQVMPYSIQDRLSKQSPFADISQALSQCSVRAVETPYDANNWSNLAIALRCSGNLEAAIAAYKRALAIQPDSAAVLSNLGGALRAACRLDEAIICLQRAIQLEPNLASAQFNLGLALEDAGSLDEALNCYERALLLEPKRTDAVIQKAYTLLAMGRLEEGFQVYERRLEFEAMLQRNFEQPQWNGQSFAGKTLLLYAEQGRGDTFQFIRYASMAKALGGSVIVECQPDTADIVRKVSGVDQVVNRGDSLPHFDYCASLMSLPFIFKTTLQTIPQSIPYLRVPDQALGSVSLRPADLFRVGIVWTSGHEDVGANERSVPFAHFVKLLEAADIALYSLQVGDSVSDIEKFGCRNLIQDLGKQFKSFASTADAIQQLDLVITVDTSVAHLAGGLGKSVWVLLPFASEWRWLQKRSDSPWYPVARLYRQEHARDWAAVFDRVVADLRDARNDTGDLEKKR